MKEKAYLKMKYYTEYAPEEVGGLLELTKEKGKIILDDVILLKQSATWGDFEIEDEALTEFMTDIMTNNPDKMCKINGWWHKHPIEGWSAHDDSTFETLKKYFGGFVFGIVAQNNNFNKPLSRLEVGKKQWLRFETPYLTVIKSRTRIDKRKLKKKCKQEVDKCVVTKKYTTQHYGGITYFPNSPYNDIEDEFETPEPLKDRNIMKDLVTIYGRRYDMKTEFGCSEYGGAIHCLNCPSYAECKKELVKIIDLQEKYNGKGGYKC